MAGKKDNVVVMVLTNVTNAQAAQVVKEVFRIKGCLLYTSPSPRDP